VVAIFPGSQKVRSFSSQAMIEFKLDQSFRRGSV